MLYTIMIIKSYIMTEFLKAQGMIPLDVSRVNSRLGLKRSRPTESVGSSSKRQRVSRDEQRLAIATSSRVKVEDTIDIGALEVC